MKRLVFAFAFCLLTTPALGQQIETDAPAPLTLNQLVAAQREAHQRLTLLSYRLDYQTDTLDDTGVTGSKRGTWDVLRLERDVRVTKVAESRSTLKRVSVPGRQLALFVRSMPTLFEVGCPARLVRWEKRREGFALLYRTTYTGLPCFDGLVWVNERGRVLEAEGRFEPAREYCDGELVWPRIRLKMNGEGLPETIEGEDLLTFYSARDKNGGPLRVRVRLSARFSDYRRARSAEPEVTYGDIIP